MAVHAIIPTNVAGKSEETKGSLWFSFQLMSYEGGIQCQGKGLPHASQDG